MLQYLWVACLVRYWFYQMKCTGMRGHVYNLLGQNIKHGWMHVFMYVADLIVNCVKGNVFNKIFHILQLTLCSKHVALLQNLKPQL